MTTLVKHHVPISEEEARKPPYKKIGDTARRCKINAGAKFNYDFVELAARLVASGHSETDLAYVMGVKFFTINSWKKRYPQFKAACEAGKDIAHRHMVAKMFRAACGYEYEESMVIYDADGTVKSKKVFQKHQPADAKLLTFILPNLDPDHWKNRRELQINEDRKVDIRFDGQLDADEIRRFAGRILEKYSQRPERKSIISTDVSGDTCQGQGAETGLLADVPGETADSI